MRIQRSPAILIAAVVLLIVGPVLLQVHLAKRDSHYSELISQYECRRDTCEADFNGDGILGRVIVEQTTPDESAIVVLDGDRELLRYPREFIDTTFRTHFAIMSGSDGSRLLVFDGTKIDPVNAVFAWDGQGMRRVPPSASDREILSAMAAHDDGGTWGFWAVYRFLSLPFLIVYYLLMAIILTVIIIRGRAKTFTRRDS